MTDATEDARRAAILDAAGGLFITQGFQATTTLDVARRARVSKRDLYKLFPSKEALLDAMMAHYSRAMQMPPDLPPPDNRAVFLAVLTRFGEHLVAAQFEPYRVAYMRFAAAEATRTPALGAALIESGARPVRDSLDRFIAAAAGRGILAEADVPLIRDAYFNTLLGPLVLFVVIGARPAPDADEIARRAAQAVDVVRRLIGPE